MVLTNTRTEVVVGANVVVEYTCHVHNSPQNQDIAYFVNSTAIKYIDPNNSFTDLGSRSINGTAQMYLRINTTNFSTGVTAVTCWSASEQKTAYLYVCEDPGIQHITIIPYCNPFK